MNRVAHASLVGCWFATRVALLLALAGAVGAYALWKTVDGEFRQNEVSVPDVRGLTLDDATARLLESDLVLSVDAHRPVVGMPVGHVAWQDPAPGASTRRQRLVKVVVSSGAAVAVVPDLVGKSRREAQLAVRAAHAQLGQVRQVASQQPVDLVLAQSPVRGEPLAEGGTIDLLVSRGPTRRAYVMPDLRGQPVRRAESLLDSVGLRVASRRDEYAPGVPPGHVRSQSPAPGTRVVRDTAISLVVSRDAEAPLAPP